MGGNQASLEQPIAPTKKQFKLVCKVFEVRNGRREAVKQSVNKFHKTLLDKKS